VTGASFLTAPDSVWLERPDLVQWSGKSKTAPSFKGSMNMAIDGGPGPNG
jgi:hypothetical protein